MEKTTQKNLPVFAGIIRQLSADPESVAGPPPGWPSKLWLVETSDGKHGCAKCTRNAPLGKAPQVEGIAVFRYKANAEKFLYAVKHDALLGHRFIQITFNEAVNLVYSKPPLITALILSDDPENPRVFDVR